MLCSKCAADLPEVSHFCPKCGQPVDTLVPDLGEPPPENATLGCSKCGASLPDGAEFCPKCGKPIALPANTTKVQEFAGIVDGSPPASRKKRSRRVVLWVLLGVFVVAIVWIAGSDNPFAQGIQELVGWKHDQIILDKPFSVSAHNFRYYKFALPEGSTNVAIVGQFAVSSDASKPGGVKAKNQVKDPDDNIEVYVLSEPAFTVWQNGYTTSSVYESGRVSAGAVQAHVPDGAGIYYLVFSNKFAPKAAKNVTASVLLRYKSWLPDWFRRPIHRLLNWLGF